MEVSPKGLFSAFGFFWLPLADIWLWYQFTSILTIHTSMLIILNQVFILLSFPWSSRKILGTSLNIMPMQCMNKEMKRNCIERVHNLPETTVLIIELSWVYFDIFNAQNNVFYKIVFILGCWTASIKLRVNLSQKQHVYFFRRLAISIVTKGTPTNYVRIIGLFDPPPHLREIWSLLKW